MMTPHVISVGLLPTAHPVSGSRLGTPSEDQLLQRRVQRSAARLADRQPPSPAATFRSPKRPSMVA
jgi:hypothetical protein